MTRTANGKALFSHRGAETQRRRDRGIEGKRERSCPASTSLRLFVTPSFLLLSSVALWLCGSVAIHRAPSACRMAFGQSIQSDCIHVRISRHARNDHLIPKVKAIQNLNHSGGAFAELDRDPARGRAAFFKLEETGNAAVAAKVGSL